MKSKKCRLASITFMLYFIAGNMGYAALQAAEANDAEPAAPAAASYPADAAAKLAELAAKYPAVDALKTHEPQAYENLKQVVAEDVKAKKPDGQITYDADVLFADYEHNKIPRLSDELMVKGFNADLEVGRKLQTTSPDQCVKFLTNQPGGYVKPELLDNEWAVYNEVIIAPQATNPTVATKDETKTAIMSIINKEAAAQNINHEEVSNIFAGKEEPVKTCNFTLAYLSDIAALPPATMRAILNMSK